MKAYHRCMNERFSKHLTEGGGKDAEHDKGGNEDPFPMLVASSSRIGMPRNWSFEGFRSFFGLILRELPLKEEEIRKLNTDIALIHRFYLSIFVGNH